MIGSQRIASFSDPTREARAITAIYDDCRQEILCENAWTFAQKRVLLTEAVILTGAPAWVAGHAYAVGDLVLEAGLEYVCLVAHTSTVFATDLASVYWQIQKLDPKLYAEWDGIIVAYSMPNQCLKINYISQYSANHKIEVINGVKYILADTEGLGIKYTYDCDDPTLYFPKFTQAFAQLLAYRLCFNLSESRNKAADIFTEYNEVTLKTACAADSAQGTPDEPAQDDWDNARLSAGSPFVIRPGQLTWGYIW
jgi:hypothetical protein